MPTQKLPKGRFRAFLEHQKESRRITREFFREMQGGIKTKDLIKTITSSAVSALAALTIIRFLLMAGLL